MGVNFMPDNERAFAGDLKCDAVPPGQNWSWRGDFPPEERSKLPSDEQLYAACRLWHFHAGSPQLSSHEEKNVKVCCLEWYRIFCRVGIINLKGTD